MLFEVVQCDICVCLSYFELKLKRACLSHLGIGPMVKLATWRCISDEAPLTTGLSLYIRLSPQKNNFFLF